MPCPAPVTIATLPSSRPMLMRSLVHEFLMSRQIVATSPPDPENGTGVLTSEGRGGRIPGGPSFRVEGSDDRAADRHDPDRIGEALEQAAAGGLHGEPDVGRDRGDGGGDAGVGPDLAGPRGVDHARGQGDGRAVVVAVAGPPPAARGGRPGPGP